MLVIGFLIGSFLTSDSLDDFNINFQGNFLKNDLKGNSNIVAVSGNGFGIIGKVNVDIVDGEGLVLVNTNPFLEADTQLSAVTAVNVAKGLTQVNLENKNVIIDFNVPNINLENQGVVGGPSAGVAMTLAVVAALNQEEVKDIIVTGAILPNGNIGQVGGIVEKADIAADTNHTLFIIPKGQGEFIYYERQVRTRNVRGFNIRNFVLVPKSLDLIEYFQEEKNLTMVEVNNIQDVLELAF